MIDTTNAVLISFPKSGRTWLRFMLNHLGLKFDVNHAGSSHREAFTFDTIADGPKQFADRKIILMVRDPRDTVISGYFQATRRLQTYSAPFSDFLRDPRHGIEKIIRFNLLWLNAAQDDPRYCKVSYESLHRETGFHLTRAAEFLGFSPIDENRIAEAVTAGSFDNMRRIEESGKTGETYGKALSPIDPSDINSYKTRRGIVGSWKIEMSEADQAYANALLDRYDYPLEPVSGSS